METHVAVMSRRGSAAPNVLCVCMNPACLFCCQSVTAQRASTFDGKLHAAMTLYQADLSGQESDPSSESVCVSLGSH